MLIDNVEVKAEEWITRDVAARTLCTLQDRANAALTSGVNLDAALTHDVLAILALSAAYVRRDPPPGFEARCESLLLEVVGLCCAIELNIQRAAATSQN